MTEVRILVVEDEADQRHLVLEILSAAGFQVAGAESAEEALREVNRSPVDLILADWKLPEMDGLSLLAQLREKHPSIAFIMVTAYGTIARAVEAIRAGADDYLPKPFERQALLLAIERTLRARRLLDENRRLSEALEERDRLVDLVGSAPSMQKLFRRVEKVASTDATVLLSGESGTGKELAARALHTLSRRQGKAFVAVNCAAIPEGLLEAEFFGAERGAFTGADRRRAGKFEVATDGTLFLDEVGELPLSLQPKLLRALQEGRFNRVGGTDEISVDFRLIAATNRDLPAEVAAGRFREDLFYRLNVVPIRLPPLRERREDIPRLIRHFAAGAARRHGITQARFPKLVLRRLIDYSWPGNVRELANAVERLILLAEDDQVRQEDLPASFTRPAGGSEFRLGPGGLSWVNHERNVLEQALELANNNRARAARLLDLPYKAFLYRLQKHGLAES
ncbi:MAG: sigma-54 dependent transcriptional regulator [Deltaproteobacteria bacterium]|nr:sigma-54 dependent transcriptional regulator [Deltaproteobacteria bacterium]